MNKDIIYREDAIRAIEELPNAYNGWSDTYDKAYIIGTLEEVSSADRPQGEWIEHKWIEYNEELMLEIPMHNYECSKCHSILHGVKETNFCPNCGAQMEGVDNERQNVQDYNL